jgi:hypothetical protein
MIKFLINWGYSHRGYSAVILTNNMGEGNTIENLSRELKIRNYSQKTAGCYTLQ